jgi:hypothetical protein
MKIILDRKCVITMKGKWKSGVGNDGMDIFMKTVMGFCYSIGNINLGNLFEMCE